jgi:hypothetical protein
MALKMFKKDNIVPNVGDLVSPRSLSGTFTGIVIKIKESEDDLQSQFFKGKPRKIFVIQWIAQPNWQHRGRIRTEYFAHQLEIVSKA